MDGRLKLYQAHHGWFFALTLVPSEIDILHFLYQKTERKFHCSKRKTIKNNSILNILQSHIFLCFPWGHLLQSLAPRSVPVKVTVAPLTAVLGVVSISDFAKTAVSKILGILGLQILMSQSLKMLDIFFL